MAVCHTLCRSTADGIYNNDRVDVATVLHEMMSMILAGWWDGCGHGTGEIGGRTQMQEDSGADDAVAWEWRQGGCCNTTQVQADSGVDVIAVRKRLEAGCCRRAAWD